MRDVKMPPAEPRAVVIDGVRAGARRQARPTLVEGCCWLAVVRRSIKLCTSGLSSRRDALSREVAPP
jgi:hypothetical protein